MSAGWSNLELPALVQLLGTRPPPSGDVAAATVLVDRTCLGIKYAHVLGSMDLRVVDELVEDLAEVHGGMEECEPLFAQSMVFHALDYARALGFSPHEDFVEALFGPRPEALIDTPWSRPSRPINVPGPRDAVRRAPCAVRLAPCALRGQASAKTTPPTAVSTSMRRGSTPICNPTPGVLGAASVSPSGVLRTDLAPPTRAEKHPAGAYSTSSSMRDSRSAR